MNSGYKWESFDKLLTWACWYVIESILRGEELRRAMGHVLDVARRAEFE